jgi:phosphohistidine phosphatase SixA
MLVLLLRHGHDDRTAGDDPPLSALGHAQVRATAAQILEHCPAGIEELWCSPARRARDTAAVLRAHVLLGRDRVDARLGPGASVTGHLELIARAYHQSVRSLMIIGHNPALGAIALHALGEHSEQRLVLIGHGECIQLTLQTGAAPLVDRAVVLSGSGTRDVVEGASIDRS